MNKTSFTIGMAGHIDHGKTTLTKALTGIDTDRLKQEKERNISIELGYAKVPMKDGTEISVVDVPGHERFVRQMIAGVAGIDLVVLVIAADEGVMPQTKEHLQILQFLGLEHGIIAVTKIDRVDDELREMVGLEIKEIVEQTAFADAPLVYVNSLTGKGVNELKGTISRELQTVKQRDQSGTFRLPIDQVFSVQGIGTIVRGTIYEGMVKQGSELTILPSNQSGRARNIQVHHQDVTEAWAGQRTAINVSGLDQQHLNRGDVVVTSNHFITTDTIDVAVRFVDDLHLPVKQRSSVKLHVGTSEVYGRIVFFDRNVVEKDTEEILCQIRLDNSVVARRGDRFILRRPTPVETIAGGWIIDPKGEKYRYGERTIMMLHNKKEGTPEQRITELLNMQILLDRKELIQLSSIGETEVDELIQKGIDDKKYIPISNNKFMLTKNLKQIKQQVVDNVKRYHEHYPMRLGLNKTELMQTIKESYPNLAIDFAIQALVNEKVLKKQEQYLKYFPFHPHPPKHRRSEIEKIIEQLQQDGLHVKKWEEYIQQSSLSEQEAMELFHYLLHTNQAYALTDNMIVAKTAIDSAINELKSRTGNSFDLKEAKEIWNVSRKYLIPMLELLDELKLTVRNETKRKWV